MSKDYLTNRAAETQRAVLASLTMTLLIIGVKTYAYYVTNSVAIFSSALESVMDIVASVTAYYALKAAHAPPDRSHRFGHGKAESLVSIFQVTLVAISGVYLLIESWRRLKSPVTIIDETFGIGVMIFSSCAILILLFYQHKIAKKTQSIAVKADFLNYLNDFAVGMLVIVALIINKFTNITWIDAACGFVVGVYIIVSALRVARSAANELMDHELSRAERNIIQNIVAAHPAARGMHDLRTRRAGPNIFIEFHLELDGTLTLYSAHVITDSLEEDIKGRFPGAHVSIHQEPAGIVDHRLDDLIHKK